MKFQSATTALAVFLMASVATPAMAQTDRTTHFDGPYISGFVGGSLQPNDGGDTLVFDTDGDGSFDDDVLTAATPPANAFAPGFCNGAGNTALAADGCRGDKDGIEYGVRIGYDKRLGGGNFVLGGLFEASKSKARDFTTGFSSTPAGYAFQRELDYALSLRARAGFTPGGGALFYATGGGSYARIDHKFVTTNTANSFDEQRDKKMVWGWQAGGGAEVMLTNNISLGLEYLYNRYDDNKYFVAVGPGTAPPTNPFLLVSGGTNMKPSDDKFAFHSVRAAISFQF